MDTVLNKEDASKYFRWAMILAIGTVIYNFGEGLVSIFFGMKDETLALFGFGADSFIETISALGVVQMIVRIRRNPGSSRGPFEVRALRITGWCFYALTAILSAGAVISIIQGREPESTFVGLIVSSISIFTMWALIRAKIFVGEKLDSAPIIADARCNQVCLYMSIILLISSGLYYFFELPYVDALGSLALVWFCVKEGREAFDKAKGIECNDCCDD
ncbi:MAG: cation transporter [Bacteroidetes bacterium]|nr:cation transporter [Bacteroidota bacterium]